tara:strand:- start:56 stop:241 length:186 start_codon:yes stop_codon:yes gene_type:complete
MTKPPPQTDLELKLPEPPERPDCCGGGCAICVLEDYVEEVQAWEKQCEEIRQQNMAQGKAS